MKRDTISIPLPTTDESMLARECPNCHGKFEIDTEDFESNYYLNLRCPYCQMVFEFEDFHSEEQIEYIECQGQNEALALAESEINEVMEEFNRELNKMSNDFLKVKGDFSGFDVDKENLPSPHLTIDTKTKTCSECGFQFSLDPEIEVKKISCPVCR